MENGNTTVPINRGHQFMKALPYVLILLFIIITFIIFFIIGQEKKPDENRLLQDAGLSQNANETSSTPSAQYSEIKKNVSAPPQSVAVSPAVSLFNTQSVSPDDDPVMGNPQAPITIIEFSDFECPLCKKFFDQTLPQLKKEYIDTGIVKLIYRDFPLTYHPNAFFEAEAAQCAREHGGNEAYFRYHDEIFKRTESNGTGLALKQFPIIAQYLGMDISRFQQCIDSRKYQEEVNKDMADASAAGAVGTPTFFIGRLTPSNKFEGMKLGGAYPFKTFQIIIDYQLQQMGN